MRSLLRSGVLVLGLLVGLLSVGVAPAAASCVQPAALPLAVQRASSAFVGTVTATTWQGRRATVAVSEVWRGPVTSPAAVVGTPGTEHTQTTVDRTYVVGETYLFLPYAVEAGVWQDNGCSSTQVFRPRLQSLRPAGAIHLAPSPSATRVASPAQSPEGSSYWPWALGGAAAATAAAAGLLRRRRRTGRLS